MCILIKLLYLLTLTALLYVTYLRKQQEMQSTARAFIHIHYVLPVPSNTCVGTLDVCFL